MSLLGQTRRLGGLGTSASPPTAGHMVVTQRTDALGHKATSDGQH